MRHSLFPLGLFLIWLGSYIGYPLWYLPQENLRGLVFWIFLIFFIVNFLLLDRFIYFLNTDIHRVSYHPIKREKIIWLSGIIYFSLQLYPIMMPVLSRHDEEHHLTSSLVYYLKFSSLWEKYTKISWHWCIWILLFLFIYLIRKKIKIDFLRKKRVFIALALSAGAIIYYLLLARYTSLESFFYLFHYPLFSKFFYMAAYSLFGLREFGPRIVQTIFGFLSAIYLYKLVSLYRSREVALFSFILWLFMPACFFFGNLALLVNGISFFFISSFYYLLRFNRDKSSRSLFPGVFILCIGTMYQQPVIAALFIYCLYLLSLVILKKISISKDEALRILPAWAVLVTALPYLVLTKVVYVPFNYSFFPSKLFLKAAYLEQIKLTFSGLSFIHIFFLAIGIIITIRRKDIFSLFTFIWFVTYFLFQITYYHRSVFRLLVPYFPVLAIWMAEGFGLAAVKNRMFKGLITITLAYTILTSTVWIVPPLSPQFMLYHNIHSRYVPYPEAMLYLKKNLHPDERCLSPGHSSPEKFYCLKFGFSPSQIDHAWWWAGGVELQTGDNLYEYAKSHKIKFCLFPSGDWPKLFLNFSLRDSLANGKDRRFVLEKIFYSGDNKLYLLKVK